MCVCIFMHADEYFLLFSNTTNCYCTLTVIHYLCSGSKSFYVSGIVLTYSRFFSEFFSTLQLGVAWRVFTGNSLSLFCSDSCPGPELTPTAGMPCTGATYMVWSSALDGWKMTSHVCRIVLVHSWNMLRTAQTCAENSEDVTPSVPVLFSGSCHRPYDSATACRRKDVHMPAVTEHIF